MKNKNTISQKEYNMKQALLLVYDSFADFEVTILLTCIDSEYQVKSFTVEHEIKSIQSCAGFQVIPHLTIDKVNPEEFDVLIIPGGNPVPLLNNMELKKIVQHFYRENKKIAAICGGPAILGAAGILGEVKYTASLDADDPLYSHVLVPENQVKEHLVIDKNVITSTGSNYLNFAEAVLRKTGVFTDDMKEPLSYFRVPSMN
jgi:protein deglycase